MMIWCWKALRKGSIAMTTYTRSDVEIIAREAGALAMTYFKQNSLLEMEEKQHLDLVTKADKAVEVFIRGQLAALYPDDGFFGEESASDGFVPQAERIWVIDPIDGTFNFIRGSKDWAISIGLYENMDCIQRASFGVIYAPAADIMISGGHHYDVEINGQKANQSGDFSPRIGCVGIGFHPAFSSDAVLGMIRYLLEMQKITFRHVGSACISMLQVAQGSTDGYIGIGDSSWDVMASMAILEKLGYETTIDWPQFTLAQKQVFMVGKPNLVWVMKNQCPGLSGWNNH